MTRSRSLITLICLLRCLPPRALRSTCIGNTAICERACAGSLAVPWTLALWHFSQSDRLTSTHLALTHYGFQCGEAGGSRWWRCPGAVLGSGPQQRAAWAGWVVAGWVRQLWPVIADRQLEGCVGSRRF